MEQPRDTGALRALQLVLGYNAVGAGPGSSRTARATSSSRKRTRAPGETSGPQVARGTRAERRGRWHEWHQDRHGENMNLTLHVRDCN